MKGRILLLNSCICHNEGKYNVKKATPEEVSMLYNRLKKERKVVSYIGYPDTAKVLSKVINDEVELNRAEFEWKTGDIGIVIRLKYRLNDPKMKGKTRVSEEDFEYFIIEKIE